jgi:hypothetical protein
MRARGGGLAARGVRALGARPTLWPAAFGALRRLAPQRWWRRPPFLPVPDAAYWRFRMETAYGNDAPGRPSAEDIVDYLRWCQRSRPRPR